MALLYRAYCIHCHSIFKCTWICDTLFRFFCSRIELNVYHHRTRFNTIHKNHCRSVCDCKSFFFILSVYRKLNGFSFYYVLFDFESIAWVFYWFSFFYNFFLIWRGFPCGFLWILMSLFLQRLIGACVRNECTDRDSYWCVCTVT